MANWVSIPPAARSWKPMASSERRPLGQLEHVGIVVADLERARGFFEGVLGLAISSEATLGDGAMKVAFLQSGPVRVELIEPCDELGRRERLGDAESRVEHLAFRVERLEEAAQAVRVDGVELRGGIGSQAPPTPFSGAGTRSLFSCPTSSAGVVIQLFEAVADNAED